MIVSEVLRLKVDATKETELAKRFEVTGFPSLKFWKDGEVSEYDGPREADGNLRIFVRNVLRCGISRKNFDDDFDVGGQLDSIAPFWLD